MKLLLDEMLSPAIARGLRDRGHDVQAIKRDRGDLQGVADAELLVRMAVEQRAIVTNDVADFAPLHERLVAAGEAHAGIVFSNDATLPRSRAAIPRWVDALAAFLAERPAHDALRNRVAHLP